MGADRSVFLWLLKLGAVLDLVLLAHLHSLDWDAPDPHLLISAQILLGVSAYRCLFPNRYNDNVVFHRTRLSSTFVTRVLATFSEMAYVYLFSHALRLLNVERLAWVDALSWLMVAQVALSQVFVWGAILGGRRLLYVYEELGWAVIFAANTLASLGLYRTLDSPGPGALLIHLNLLFGAVYLPWQLLHLRSLWQDARKDAPPTTGGSPSGRERLADGLHRSLHEPNRRTDAESWGGWIGLSWMTAYWATLIPLWVHRIAVVFAGS
ncbi:MAG: hypothetical protein ACQGVK_02235 [Myxococcota bacterium]